MPKANSWLRWSRAFSTPSPNRRVLAYHIYVSKLYLALCCFALLALGCGPTERSTGDGPVMTVSQKRVVFDGELGESQRAVSIVPAPGWTRRESDIFLSVVHSNGNVLNISPAY